jgi:deoxyribose-phosphate aldolase
MRNIALGADHRGYELKQLLAEHLKAKGLIVHDCGTSSVEPVDYPTFAKVVALRVAGGESAVGIMVDGAGIGSSMVANKVPGVRAALCYDVSSARNAREHNDANVLTLGASFIGPALARQIVDVFLDTQCTAERHLRRVAMIGELERGGLSSGQTDQQPACGCSTRPASVGSETAMGDLSEADLRRVADRIANLLGTSPGASDEAIAGAAGNCAFCAPCGGLDPRQARSLIDVGADRLGHRGNGDAVPKDITRYIDHTLLRPDATYGQVEKLCAEAAEFGFASVCVNPCHVRRCRGLLRGASAKVCTVVGFPLGANTPETKALEARRAIRDGAEEIDMVINVGALKSGDDEYVYRDIRRVVEACIDGGALCKVILETALLSDDEKVRACRAARRARADFVKTSTGFGPGGATVEDVALMASVVADAKMGVKASGGIRSFEDAQQMIRAGATRLGASAGVRIVKESMGVTASMASGDKY